MDRAKLKVHTYFISTHFHCISSNKIIITLPCYFVFVFIFFFDLCVCGGGGGRVPFLFDFFFFWLTLCARPYVPSFWKTIDEAKNVGNWRRIIIILLWLQLRPYAQWMECKRIRTRTGKQKYWIRRRSITKNIWYQMHFCIE